MSDTSVFKLLTDDNNGTSKAARRSTFAHAVTSMNKVIVVYKIRDNIEKGRALSKGFRDIYRFAKN